MQAKDQNLKSRKIFLFCLLTVGFAVLISNLIGKNAADDTTDLLLVVLSGALLVISIVIVDSGQKVTME